MKNLLVLFFCFCYNFSTGQDYQHIRAQLENIYTKNFKLRSQVMPIIKKYGVSSHQKDSIDKLIISYDSTSLVLVTKLIDQYGWIGKSKIGFNANQVLFLTIQHIQDKQLLKKYFPLLKESAEKGESNLSDMATMKDRILMYDGKKQIYGTQSVLVDGKLELYKIEEPKKVNKRRRKVGLYKIKKGKGISEFGLFLTARINLLPSSFM